MSEKSMTLYQKWHAIMDETAAIEKDTEVGFGNNKYRAVGEAAVLNVVKPLLKKYKVIVFPIDIKVDEIYNTILTAKGESTRTMTQLIVTWKIVDTESGENMVMQSIGNGVDNQDKGSGKAMTYAYKVLFQKSLMLFSGEDTDLEHSEKITSEREVARVSEIEVKTVKSMLAKIPGGNVEALCNWLKIKKLEDMTTGHYAKAIRFLQDKLADIEADEIFGK